MRTLSDFGRRRSLPARLTPVAVVGLAILLTVGAITVIGGQGLRTTKSGAVRTPCDVLIRDISGAAARAPEIAGARGFSPDIPLPHDAAVRRVLCVDSQPVDVQQQGKSQVIAFAVVDTASGRAWLALGAGAEEDPTDWRGWLADQGFSDAVLTDYGYATHPVEQGEGWKGFWQAVADSPDVRASVEE